MTASMMENQTSVCVWAAATFPRSSNLMLFARTLEEVAELAVLLAGEHTPAAVASEVGDNGVMLMQCAERAGLNLLQQMFLAESSKEMRGFAPVDVDHAVGMYVRYSGILFQEIAKVPSKLNPRVLGVAGHLLEWIGRKAGGVELLDAVTMKMAVNRKRSWVKREDGAHQHA